MKEEKDNHPIDDLFRQSLEGFAPPPPAAAWKNIRQQLGKGRGLLWNFLSGLPGLIILSAVIVTISAILVYNNLDTDHKTVATKDNSSTISQNKSNNKIQNPISSPVQQISPKAISNEEEKTVLNNPVNETSPAHNQIATPKTAVPEQASTIQKPNNSGSDISTGQSKEKTQKLVNSVNKQSVPRKDNKTASQSVAKTDTKRDPTNSKPIEKQDVIERSGEILSNSIDIEPTSATNSKDTPTREIISSESIGPKIAAVESPLPEKKESAEESTKKEENNSEVVKQLPSNSGETDSKANSNKEPSSPKSVKAQKKQLFDKNLFSFNIGLLGGTGQVVMQGFTPLPLYSCYATVGMNYAKWGSGIETGIGFSRQTDRGKYEFEFLKTDTTGYTGFTYFNTIDSSYLIIYKPVIDQQQILIFPTTKTSYSYISIPIYFNQQVFKSGKFAMGIKAGPSINLLIQKKDIQPNILSPGTEFIRMTNQSYTRLSTYWQLLLATRFSWQLTSHLSFLLESSAQLYLNNLYEADSKPTLKPYGIGIWTGFQYNFKK